MSNLIQLQPHLSEKSYALFQSDNVYVFDVPLSVNKITVKKSVENQFNVSVESVRILISKGKVKNSYQKRNRPAKGRRSNAKIAYVKVSSGNVIPFYEAEDKKPKATKSKDSKIAQSSKTEPTATKASGIRRVFKGTSRKTQARGGDK